MTFWRMAAACWACSWPMTGRCSPRSCSCGESSPHSIPHFAFTSFWLTCEYYWPITELCLALSWALSHSETLASTSRMWRWLAWSLVRQPCQWSFLLSSVWWHSYLCQSKGMHLSRWPQRQLETYFCSTSSAQFWTVYFKWKYFAKQR